MVLLYSVANVPLYSCDMHLFEKVDKIRAIEIVRKIELKL